MFNDKYSHSFNDFNKKLEKDFGHLMVWMSQSGILFNDI